MYNLAELIQIGISLREQKSQAAKSALYCPRRLTDELHLRTRHPGMPGQHTSHWLHNMIIIINTRVLKYYLNTVTSDWSIIVYGFLMNAL